jgi:hypothetical protein
MVLPVALVAAAEVTEAPEVQAILHLPAHLKEIVAVEIQPLQQKAERVAVEEHRLQEQTEHQRPTLVMVVTVALAQHRLFLVLL